MADCPYPSKTKYESKRAARIAIRTLYRHRANSGPGRLHAYKCGGHWHVGHR